VFLDEFPQMGIDFFMVGDPKLIINRNAYHDQGDDGNTDDDQDDIPEQ
jgi:hypothetical protein